MHWFGLAQPMTAVFSLAVYLWVEVHIVQDDSICPCQIKSLAPCPSGQQEGKDTLGWVIETACNARTWHIHLVRKLLLCKAVQDSLCLLHSA